MTRGGRVRCHSIRKSGQWPRAAYKTLGPRVPQSQDQPLPDNMSALFSLPLFDHTPIVVSVNRDMSWSSFSVLNHSHVIFTSQIYRIFALKSLLAEASLLQVVATHPHHLHGRRPPVVPPPPCGAPLALRVHALRPAACRQG